MNVKVLNNVFITIKSTVITMSVDFRSPWNGFDCSHYLSQNIHDQWFRHCLG
jgi:hypothetical protein